jgi:phage baseplate assembly protein W
MSDSLTVSTTSILGTGWSFPPEFAPRAGGVLMTSDEDDIEASLRILFGTALGERFLRPRYGLDMHEILFESMSTTLKTYLEDRIRTSVLIYEPRINPVALHLDTSGQNDGRVVLILDYVVRATNTRFNLVFPFYATDSSEVRGAFWNV